MCGVERTVVGAREAYHRPFDLFDERDGGGDGDGALFFLCAANLFLCVFRCISEKQIVSCGAKRDQGETNTNFPCEMKRSW